MAKLLQSLGILSLLLLCSACETSVRVGQADFDPAADFNSYRTFAWISDKPMIISGDKPPRMSPLLETRIMEEIRGNLTGKGYRYLEDPKTADLTVSFTVGAHDKIDIRSYPTAYQGSWGWGRNYWGYGGSKTVTWNYVEGTLAIDLFDRAKGQPVWHGWASKEILDPEKLDVEKTVKEVVDGILENFPPTAK